MCRKGMIHGFDYVNILSEQNLNKAIDGLTHVLEKTGVVVKDKQMQNVLKDYGCRVNVNMDRVYFNKAVIKKALDSCPKGFEGYARDEKNNIKFMPGKNTYFLNACGTNLVDLHTWKVYQPTRKEFYEYIRIIDALPNIDIQNCFPLFGFAKVPDCMKLIESAAAKIRVSTKVQIEGTVHDNYKFTTLMAKELGVDLFQIVNSAAPYTYFEETADQIRNYTEADLAFHFAAGPTRGLTSPMTALGSAIANNAEILAGIVMSQATKPGSRIWVNSMIMTPDMRTGKPAFGDIGNSITDMIFNQMWRRYNIPCWSNAASWTSSKQVDYQAGYELTTALVTQAMSGATAISYQGGLNAELSVSPEKAIIDDDVVGTIKRVMAGVNTSDEGFAIELINEIGPMPGTFMETDLTLDEWRDECYIPSVGNRESYENWINGGKKTVIDSAKDKMEQILKEHKIIFLDSSKEQVLEDILNDARNYYRKKGLISKEEWKIYQEDINSPNYPYA